MTIDAGVASVIVATIAAVASIVSAHLTQKQHRKVKETHKQVTVNHHSSAEPTVLDRLDDVQQSVIGLGHHVNNLRSDFNDHISHSVQVEKRLSHVESEVEKDP